MTVIDPAIVQQVIDRTLELATIPAPPLEEAARAAVVAGWWQQDGFDAVRTDAVGNVWAQVRPGTGPATVVCAHLDTVFAHDVDHTATLTATQIRGPGVGDDTVAVAALGSLDRLLPTDVGPVWLLGSVGEEGIGDLAGARAAVAAPPVELAAFIAVEGNYLGRVATTGVGSRRWRVRIEGPGGHAWERSDAPSAVHAAARLVSDIAALPYPEGHRCAVNVGRLDGGEAINARARRAAFEVDVRSEDPDALAALSSAVQAVFDPATPALEGLVIEVEPIGTRPAGHIDLAHPLVVAADGALEDLGLTPEHIAASTDANAAFAAGIPAITIGITTGAGEHTPQEWIDLAPIGTGLLALAETVRRSLREATP